MKEISENKIEISDSKEPNKDEINQLEITPTSKVDGDDSKKEKDLSPEKYTEKNEITITNENKPEDNIEIKGESIEIGGETTDKPEEETIKKVKMLKSLRNLIKK